MRKTQRLLSLLLAVIMILGTLTIGTMSISADGWDGTTTAAPAGDGSEANPYLIASAENLAWLSAQVAGGEDYEGKYFLQTADIDLNNQAFTPIGTVLVLTSKSAAAGAPMLDDEQCVAFKGTYDGGDFAIKNATIAPAEEVDVTLNFLTQVDTFYAAGIFGAVIDATIKNVHAVNVVAGTFDDTKGDAATIDEVYTAGVAGVIVGVSYNVTIDHCSTDADSAAFGAWAAGGIMGYTFRNWEMNDGAGQGSVLTRCVNNGAVVSDFVAGGMLGGGAVQEFSFCTNNGSVGTYTVFQNETFAGGIMGYGTPLANPTTDFKYCKNSEDAEIFAVSYNEGLSRRRGYTAGILGCEAGPEIKCLFSHCYNFMEEFNILDYMVNDAATQSNVLTGAILGQIKGDETFQSTFDYSMSVTAYRNIIGKNDVLVAPKQEISMGKYALPGSEIAGLVNARGNGASKAFCVPTTNAAGVSTCDYAVSEAEMREMSSKVVTALEFLKDVLDVNLEDGIPTLTVDGVRYAGVQETEIKDGKIGVRLIGVVDLFIHEAQGFIVSVSTAEGSTLYTATKLLKEQVLGGDKVYTPAQLDFGRAAFAIAIGEISATEDVIITVTPFMVEMGDDVETDRKLGATWTITYENGVFVKHLPNDGSIVEEEEIVLDLENGNDIEGEGWQGMKDYTKPTQGTGTEADPFLIEKPEHLAWLAWAVKDVNGAKVLLGAEAEVASRKVFSGVYFKQTADIDLNNQSFLPIGLKQATATDPKQPEVEGYKHRIAFGGNYDGGNFAIKNAVVRVGDYGGANAITEDHSEAYVTGLFGFVSGGSVKNVNAVNVKVGKSNVNAIMQTKAFTEVVAGGIVGMAINSTITNCTVDATSEVNGIYAGGIVGIVNNHDSVVSYCENNAKVVGSVAAGGIAGLFEGTIDYCVNRGAIEGITFRRWAGFGGIAGTITSSAAGTTKISNAINYANIDVVEKKGGASENHRVAMGGIVGNDKDLDKGTVEYLNLFNLGSSFTCAFTASGNDDILAASGGIVGISEDTQATKNPATAFVNVWSVAGITMEDHFGQKDFERLWANVNDTPCLDPFAGTMTGRVSMTQCANALGISTETEGWQLLVKEAYANAHYLRYGVHLLPNQTEDVYADLAAATAAIEALAEFQAVLAALA